MVEENISTPTPVMSLYSFLKSDFKNTIHDYLDSKSIINLMLTNKEIYEYTTNRLLPNKFICNSTKKLFLKKVDYYDNSNKNEINNKEKKSIYKTLSELWLLHLKTKYDSNSLIKNNNNNDNNDNLNMSMNIELISNDNQMTINSTYREKESKREIINSNEVENFDKNLKLKFIESSDAIDRDISRTFHFGRFQTENGKIDLRNILKQISENNQDIGYCQGMNFVAGILLEITNSVEKSIYIFQKLISFYELYYIYTEVS